MSDCFVQRYFSDKDLSTMNDYLRKYAYCEINPNVMDKNGDAPIFEDLLSPWYKSKKNLLEAFKGQLIHEKEIVVNEHRSVLEDKIRSLLYVQTSFFFRIKDWFYDISLQENLSQDQNDKVFDFFTSYLQRNIISLLVNNQIEIDQRIKVIDTVDGIEKPFSIQLNKTTKVTKVLGKICKHLGIDEQYNDFMIKYSQIMNTKQVKGTLCLSIHPMDYWTMSDNSEDWSSCMSWRDEGDYCQGTLEMMNSPMVVVAYLKSDNRTITFRNSSWNSKKWRSLLMVTEYGLFANRQYPYYHDEVCNSALDFLAEILNESVSTPYDRNISKDYNVGDYYSNPDSNLVFYFNTLSMYNDTNSHTLKIMPIVDIFNKYPNGKSIHINFSGSAYCVYCGDLLDSSEPSHILCDSCRDISRCSCCGDEYPRSELEVFEDMILCPSCYDDVIECPVTKKEFLWNHDHTIFYDQAHFNGRYRSSFGVSEEGFHLLSDLGIIESCQYKQWYGIVDQFQLNLEMITPLEALCLFDINVYQEPTPQTA